MKQRWLAHELEEEWSLTPEETALLSGRTDSKRLGFAVLLKFVQIAGYFPKHHSEVPTQAVAHLAEWLNLSTSAFQSYKFSDRMAKFHRAEIRSFLGFRPATNRDAAAAQRWLAQEALADPTERLLLEHVQGWYRQRHIEQPSLSRQAQIVQAAIQASETVLFRQLHHRLSDRSQAAISGLLAQSELEDGLSPIGFLQLKSDPARPSLETVFQELGKLKVIDHLVLPSTLTEGIADKRLRSLYLRASTESLWDLRRHPPYVGSSLVALYCWHRRTEIVDGLVELLIQLVHKINTNAEKKLVKELLSDVRAVHGKSRLLYKLADAALRNPEGTVKDVLYSVVDEETLEALVKEYEAKGPTYQRHIQTLVRSSYAGHYRAMVPKILEALTFQSNNAHHRPVIAALEYLKGLQGSKQRFITMDKVPVEEIVPPELHSLVVESDGKGGQRVNRIHYEICVLKALRMRLRCKEVWVAGADRYRNPDEDLPQDFAQKRETYYQDLQQPLEAEPFIQTIQQTMREALGDLNRTLPKNEEVSLRLSGKNRIKLTPLEPLPEPVYLGQLKGEISQRWPMTGLLDVLKEAELRIGFTEVFKGLGNREILDRDTLQQRLLLCLYGLGANTGLKRVISKEQGVTYDELLYVKRRYIHTEALRTAIADVANAIFRIRQPHIWGEGTTACASDSKKFGAWDQNLMTE